MCAPKNGASNAMFLRDAERGAQQKRKTKAKEEGSEQE
jgi:hypothetical protein